MPHPEGKREKFAELYMQGLALADIADRICVAENTLKKWPAQLGLPLRTGVRRRTCNLPAAEADAFIREHYGMGKMSASAIGRKLGISKNAVIGRARRLGLSNRGKPKWGAHGLDRISPPMHSCAWPVGDPASPDFHFCGGLSLTGKPYCREHMDRAYTRYNDPGEADAAIAREIGGAIKAIDRETIRMAT